MWLNGLILATALASPADALPSIQSESFHYLSEAGNAKAGWIRAMQLGGAYAAGPVLGGVRAAAWRNLGIIASRPNRRLKR